MVKSRLLVEGKDYVVLPEVVWKVFISWHGTTGYSIPSLPRIVSMSHLKLIDAFNSSQNYLSNGVLVIS